MREAYRKNKNMLYPLLNMMGQQADVIITYQAKSIASYTETEAKIVLTLRRLAEEIERKQKPTENRIV